MKIEIITVDDECLEGQRTGSGAAFLGKELSERGYDVARHTVFPNDSDIVVQGIREALGRSMLVVATGDIASLKHAGAQLFRTTLHTDSNLFDSLQKQWGDRPSILESARVPRNSIVLPNRWGETPGLLLISTEGSLLLLPKAFFEMKRIFIEEALPLLAEHFLVFAKNQILRMNFCQLGEPQMQAALQEIQNNHPDVKIELHSSLAVLQVRLSVNKDFERLDQWSEMLREAFSTYFFEEPTIEEAVHRLLIERNQRLALAESCTGGALSARLVAIPNASKYHLGSVVAYSNEFKEHFLHVPRPFLDMGPGPVSVEAVNLMVESLLQQSSAHLAVAISGIAGPGGSLPHRPVGTIFIAIGERNGIIDSGSILAPPDRTIAIEYAVQYALGALYRRLSYQVLTFL